MVVYNAPKVGHKATIKEDGTMSIDSHILFKSDGSKEEFGHE